MEYSKPALTFEEQADLLLSRGLIADRNTLISRLKVVNYYRLSGYWQDYLDELSHSARRVIRCVTRLFDVPMVMAFSSPTSVTQK